MHRLSHHASMRSRRGLGLLKAGSSSSSSSPSAGVKDICSPFFSRSYSSKVTSSPKPRKIKEERQKLVMDFVEKYKASNKGQLPGITILRKEVGGSYNILKEIMQDLEQERITAMALKNRPDLKKTELNDTSADLMLYNKVDATSLKEKKTVLKGKDVGSVVSKAVDVEKVECQKLEREVLKQDAKNPVACPVSLKKADIEIGKGHKVKPSAIITDQRDLSQLDPKTRNMDASVMGEILSEESEGSEEEDDDSDLAAPEYDRNNFPISSEQTCRPISRTFQTSVVIKNVPNTTSPRELREALADCGEILNAGVFPISKNKIGGAYFGMVTFKDITGFQKAQSKKEIVVRDTVVQLHAPSKEQDSDISIASGTLCTTNKEKVHKVQGTMKQSPLTAKGSEQVPVQAFSDKSVKAGPEAQVQNYARPSNPFAVRIKDIALDVSVPEIREAMQHYGDIENVFYFKGPSFATLIVWFKSDLAAAKALRDRQVKVRDQWCSILRQPIPWTSVLRISNLPDNMTARKLRSTCEKFAGVSGFNMRKGNIADVQFDVKDAVTLNNIAERLNKAGLGNIKISQAPRFFCGENPEDGFQPPRVQFARQVKDTLLNQLEQQIKQLFGHLNDCRELVVMKQDAWLS